MTDRTYPPQLIQDVIGFAQSAHAGQVDKAGRPYILHVLRVGLSGATETEMLAGFLHDVLEDTDHTVQGMLGFGIPPLVVDLVVVLTRQERETYSAYLERVADNPAAVRVKMSDLRDNLRQDRVLDIPRDLAGKYRTSLAFLERCSGLG